jgi:hypothetical protein
MATYLVIGGGLNGQHRTVLHGRRMVVAKPTPAEFREIHPASRPAAEFEHYTIRHVPRLGCEALVLDELDDAAVEKWSLV